LPVHCLDVARDGRWALSGGGYTVRLWDLETGEMVRRLKGHQKAVLGVAFGPDGWRALSGSEDRALRLWDLVNGREMQRLEGHQSWVTAVAFAPDGRSALSGSADRSICLWRLPPATPPAFDPEETASAGG
jgi:WD40 repeat protein